VSNSLTSNPAIIDSDIASWRNSSGYSTGIHILKLILAVDVGKTSSAGVVTITSGSTTLYAPLLVSASEAAETILYSDEPPGSLLFWNDFAVAGVTATGTRLLLWWAV